MPLNHDNGEPLWYVKNLGHINPSGHSVNRRVKQNYAMIWPKDKPDRGWWGRAKDIATGKGPDIFITGNPNRTPNAMDGPTRRRWTRLPLYEGDPSMRMQDANTAHINLPFSGGSAADAYKPYDFRKRRYKRPDISTWSNAVWAPGDSNWPANLELLRTIGQPPIPFRPWGAQGQFDARNWGNCNPVYGEGGKGGWWHPGQTGWPPYPTPWKSDPRNPWGR